MPSINFSERDFELVAGAAMDAKANSDMAAARGLDMIARKMNAALASQATKSPFGRVGKALSWRDVPSTIEDVALTVTSKEGV